jgi:hypothetical protein
MPAGGYLDVPWRLSSPYARSSVYIVWILDATNALVETGETNTTILSGLTMSGG